MTDAQKKIGELICRAWCDDEFRTRLLSDTEAVLRENGVHVPDGVKVQAIENSEAVYYLFIPPKPELREVEITAKGGDFCSCCCQASSGCGFCRW